MTARKYIEVVGGSELLPRREAGEKSVSVGELKHLLSGLSDDTKLILSPLYSRRSKDSMEYQPVSMVCLSVVEEGKK